jgi:hypothetical protein
MSAKNIYENKSGIPISLHSNLAENYDIETGGSLSEYTETLEPNIITIDPTETFRNINSQYVIEKRKRLIGKVILKGTTDFLRLAVDDVASVTNKTGVGYFLTKGSQVAFENLLDHTLDEYDKETIRNVDKIVGKHLYLLRSKENMKFESIAGGNRDEKIKSVLGIKKGIFEQSISDFDENEKANVIYHMAKSLENRIENHLALNTLADKAINKNVQKEIDKVKALSRGFFNIQKDQSNQLENIKISLEGFRNKLDKLNNKVNKNSKDIYFLKTLMTKNLDLDEQIELIESGFIGDRNNPENLKKLDRLKLLQSKKDFDESLVEYMNGTNSVLKIINNLGFKSKHFEKIQEFNNIASTLGKAYLKWNPSNPMASIEIVSSLFGGGTDIAGSRHKQVIHRLKIIDKKLDKVLDNQKEILKAQLENIKLTISAIKEIRNLALQFDLQHYRVMTKLENIHEDLLINRKLITENAYKNIKKLGIFIKWFKTEKQYKLKNGRIFLLENRRQHWYDFHTYFNGAVDDLLYQLSLSNVGYFFRLITYSKKGGTDYFSKKLISYNLIYDYLSKIDSNILKNLVLGCSYPVSNSIDLLKKNKFSFSGFEDIEFTDLKIALLPLKIDEVSNMLMETHEYFILRNRSNHTKLIDKIENLYRDKIYSKLGLRLFKKLIQLVNISILQEVLIGGDQMLSLIYEDLIRCIKNKSFESSEYENLLRLINFNQLLEYNLNKLFITKQLEERYNYSQLDYCLSRGELGKVLLSNFFPDYISEFLAFKKNEETKYWVIKLPSFIKKQEEIELTYEIKIFDFTEYSNGEFSVSSEIEKLFITKNFLLDCISDYEHQNYFKKYKDHLYYYLAN